MKTGPRFTSAVRANLVRCQETGSCSLPLLTALMESSIRFRESRRTSHQVQGLHRSASESHRQPQRPAQKTGRHAGLRRECRPRTGLQESGSIQHAPPCHRRSARRASCRCPRSPPLPAMRTVLSPEHFDHDAKKRADRRHSVCMRMRTFERGSRISRNVISTAVAMPHFSSVTGPASVP